MMLALAVFLAVVGGAWLLRTGESDEQVALTRDVCAQEGVSLQSPLFDAALEDVLLADANGSPVRLHSCAGTHLTVLLFVAYSCPCSHGYLDRLRSLSRDYLPRGVRFWAIHSNGDETSALMSRYVTEHTYPFPVLRDRNAYLADRVLARVTPEAFVFDSTWTLQYHGRIDDDKGGLFVTDPSLRHALDTLLLGRPLIARDKPGSGCAITR